MFGALFLVVVSAARAGPGDATAHPILWPEAHSVGLVDTKSEKLVDDLLARMSLEEKVGQMIQADIAYIKPEDLRSYPLGSVLAGGNSPPLSGNDRDPAPQWLASTRRFHEVALEQRAGHIPIPLIFGIDAVHGNSNVKGHDHLSPQRGSWRDARSDTGAANRGSDGAGNSGGRD